MSFPCRVASRSGRANGRALVTLILSLVAAAFTPGNVRAAEPLFVLDLSPAQRAAVARAFAPTLVLHPLENYFPTSSMFPLGDDAVLRVDGNGRAVLPVGLESWQARVDRYRGLSREEKLARAALGYRVFSRIHQGRAEVVVEYWCYYVYNEFTVRGAWLPYRVHDNHPHDLERLFLTLTPTPGRDSSIQPVADEEWALGAFRIRSVIANAHDGSIPPNEYDVPDDKVLIPPLTVLVELGSHAMAPDLNRDGRFTPGIDSTKILKLQWGIRDRGATWGRYRASFMDGRDASAERLCGSSAALLAEADHCSPYDLYPAGDLQSWFQTFELSSRDRPEIIGRSPWLIRTFGDIRMDQLMVPTDPPDGRVLDRDGESPHPRRGGFRRGVDERGCAGAHRRTALFLGRAVPPCA